ncbi:MAG: efflux RND transporter permease subunit [Gemmatimonadaceae bacterium]
MNLPAFAVRNRAFTIVIFAALIALGVSSLFAIPKTEDPTFPYPSFAIVAIYPGASPTDLEELVVDPIEDRIKELENVKELRASIEDGVAVVRVEFTAESDADEKYDEILREINSLRASLPGDLYSLEVERFNAADVNIVQLALVSETAPYHDLERRARDLEDALTRVSGIKTADKWAYPRREVRVAIDLGRLAQYRLSLTRALGAIQSENANVPAGAVDVGNRKYNVKTSGNYESLDELRETIVGATDGRAVHLRDVAAVQWSYAELNYFGRYNGKRAVFVTANMKERENIITVRDAVWSMLDRFEATLPPTITLTRGFDQSRNVVHRLTHLGRDFAIAILLVLVTLLPLGFRAAGIVTVAIPLSLAVGVTLLNAAGFTINQLSIVGFVIALGLLVDDSIVVVENIARHLRAGLSRRQAAVTATRQITLAVIGCTATLVFAFVPILLLPGAAGKFIRGMPMAVVFTILASLLVSLTIIPFLASVFLREQRDEHGNVFLRALNRAIDATYAPVLHRALARPVITLVTAGVLFVLSLGLVPVVGFSLFPKAGTPQFLVTVETPTGASVTETDSAVRFVERALVPRPDVASVFASVGRGNPRVYYNVISRAERPNIGEVFVRLHEYDAGLTPIMLDSLRQRFDRYAGARIEVKEFENGPPIDAPIALRVSGANLDTLRALAGRVERLLESTTGTRGVVNPLRLERTDLKLSVDRAKAGLLGVPAIEIDRTVRAGIAGLTAGKFRDVDGQEYDITLTLPRGARPTLDALDRIYVSAVSGAQVPLRQLATVRFEASPPVVQHEDAERSITVTSSVRTGYNTDRLTKDVLAQLESWTLPDGYTISAAGELESRQESFGGLGTAILLATFGILAILVLEFRTFKGMVIAASVIPLGIIGGLVALLFGGYTLSFTAMIGFVALIGIEIKNSILLVDFTNQLRAEGVPLIEAIERAGNVRFLPIVLTTMTAIGGLVPLALERSSLYSPLALVIIGGLVSSTILSRLVTPVMYRLLPPALPAVEEATAVQAAFVPATA